MVLLRGDMLVFVPCHAMPRELPPELNLIYDSDSDNELMWKSAPIGVQLDARAAVAHRFSPDIMLLLIESNL